MLIILLFFLMIRRPPRSTLDRSSAASDVYKRQITDYAALAEKSKYFNGAEIEETVKEAMFLSYVEAVSYTHLRAHETVLDLVCRLLLEKKKLQNKTPGLSCKKKI